MSLDFYRSLYEAEWSRRTDVRQAAGLPAGILIVLAGALVFYARSYAFPTTTLGSVTAAFLATAAAAWVIAVYMLARALFGPRYLRIPWPSQIREYEQALGKYYERDSDGTTIARHEFELFLVDRYIDAANRNSANNASSGEYVYNANRAALVALAFIGLAAAPVVMESRSTHLAAKRADIVHAQGIRDASGHRDYGAAAAHRDTIPADTRSEADGPSEHRSQNRVQSP